MQRNEWTFDGSVEVTVNLFSMHACEFVVGNKIIKQKWLRDQIREFEKYFSKQPTYEDWKSDNYLKKKIYFISFLFNYIEINIKVTLEWL